MTYERYDVGSPQSGVRRTSPNVDRVMGLASTQESTVDRLLTVVERLTAELATTQSALHDLALEVARAGIGSGAAATAPDAGYGTGVSLSSGTVPLPSDNPSALPPRRSDHAVIQDLDAYTPAPHIPAEPAAAPQVPPAGGVDPLAGVVPADPVDADPAQAEPPHGAEVAARPTPEQQAVAEASAAAATAVAAAAAAAQVAAHPRAAYGGPTTVPAASLAAPASEPERLGLVASLTDVQLLSAGAVDVMVGPVRDLADLDAVESRILALQGVDAVTVMAFEGRDVLVKIEIERPLPLASMLRTELGRPVESCRLVEGRIVVTFADPEPTA
ncbi:hypothetical protein AB0L40_22195 [Patulibacter sp. NPDC049589]|uniref:hypothetical protein n=1 Tax=Patulibacter sp. NPDC049589 TaxID=3154731 RepID=UPI003427CE7D